MDHDDLERRHAALIDRDRWIGLEAEAASARARAARLQEKVDLYRTRLSRKNARIEQLAARVKALEDASAPSGLVARLARSARRRR